MQDPANAGSEDIAAALLSALHKAAKTAKAQFGCSHTPPHHWVRP